MAVMTPGLDPRWPWWAAACAIPALVIGIFLYPNVQIATMPLAPALLVVVAATGGILLAGRPRLIVIVPLAASYLPSLQIGFLAYAVALAVVVPLALPRRINRPLDTADWALLAVLLLAGASWLANLGPQTDIWSLPMFALTFLSPWLLFFFARGLVWTSKDLHVLAGIWLALAVSQVVVALLKPLVLGLPAMYAVALLLFQLARLTLIDLLPVESAADLTFGSTISPHHLGVVMLLAAAFLTALGLASRRARWFGLAAAVLFVFLMTDSKHAILAALLPAVWYAAEVPWPRLDTAWRTRLAGAGLAIGIVVLAVLGARVWTLVVTGLWRPYVTLATVNPKMQLVLRTADRMAEGGLHMWVGHGPGSYASRAATIRASDVLYKRGERAEFIPPHTGDAYRDVAYDLYTSEIAMTVRYRSGALTSPFSSVVGIIAEFGLAGSVAMLALLAAAARLGFKAWRADRMPAAWCACGAACGFGMPLLLFLGIFDSYFEQPDVTAVLMHLLLVAAVAPEVAARRGTP